MLMSVISVSAILLMGYSRGEITLKYLDSVYIPYTYTDVGPVYDLDKNAAEQNGFDPRNMMVYSVGEPKLLHVIDISNPTDLKIVFNTSLPERFTPTDVDVCGAFVAVSVKSEIALAHGLVVLYSLYNRTDLGGGIHELSRFEVGVRPDGLAFNKGCEVILVANEGAAAKNTTSGEPEDPEGSVSIITLKSPLADSTVKTLDFANFNARADEYVSNGVRWIARNISAASSTFSQDLEPESITFSKDGSKAYVCFQENNAIASIDISGDGSVEEIFPLGFKNWSNYGGFDASDKDGVINIHPWDVLGMYQPDAIKYFEHGGVGYIATANEGNKREFTESEDGFDWNEEIKGADLAEGGLVAIPELIPALTNKSALGRLRFSATSGKGADGKYHSLYTFGGRSFSIFKASDMSLVWDSGNEFEKKHQMHYGSIFNSDLDDDNELPSDGFDARSDNKGPEPESMAIAQVGKKTVFFIGNERTSTIIIYSLEGAEVVPKFESLYRAGGLNKTWRELFDDRNIGDIDPEEVRYIRSDISPNGKPLLLVSGSKSGTLSVYEIKGLDEDKTTEKATVDPETGGGHSLRQTVSVLCVFFMASLTSMMN